MWVTTASRASEESEVSGATQPAQPFSCSCQTLTHMHQVSQRARHILYCMVYLDKSHSLMRYCIMPPGMHMCWMA
jgi:hypothetical protein